MRNKGFLFLVCLIVCATIGDVRGQEAQQSEASGAVFRVEVDMVLLNVAVMDGKGNYVTGLRPGDFEIYEDGLEQQVATFGEGNAIPRRLAEFSPGGSQPRLVQP